MKTEVTHVVAAVVQRGKRYLCMQRGRSQYSYLSSKSLLQPISAKEAMRTTNYWSIWMTNGYPSTN